MKERVGEVKVFFPDPYLDEIILIDEKRNRSNFFSGLTTGLVIACLLFSYYVVPDYLSLKFHRGGSPQMSAISAKLIVSGAVTKVTNKLRPSVVEVMTWNKTGQKKNLIGTGSGIIFSHSGYIITNEHVISESKEITVRTMKGDQLKAVLVGSSKDDDVAVLKVNAHLAVPKFGSKEINIGQLAILIGSSFGIPDSVSAGVISGVGKSVTVSFPKTDRVYKDLIQTDAPINPGNSGGPLADRFGNVIGINSLIYSTTGISQGIGFAIPIEKVLEAADKIIASKKK